MVIDNQRGLREAALQTRFDRRQAVVITGAQLAGEQAGLDEWQFLAAHRSGPRQARMAPMPPPSFPPDQE